MRLGDFPVVESLVSARHRLMVQLDSGIDVLIKGELQTPDFADAVTPAIPLEIGRRIIDIDAQLRLYGVDVSSPTLG